MTLLFLLAVSLYSYADISPYEQVQAMHKAGAAMEEMVSWCEQSKSTEFLTFLEINELAKMNYPIEVIECLLEKAAMSPGDSGIIKYENHAFWLSDHIRAYFKQEKTRLKLVITNLDERGNRLGGNLSLEEEEELSRIAEERRAQAFESEPEPVRVVYEQPPLQMPPQQDVVEYDYPYIYYGPPIIFPPHHRRHVEETPPVNRIPPKQKAPPPEPEPEVHQSAPSQGTSNPRHQR
ncbi:MAG: hypothetical protein A2Y62_14750 [Candidatus Fischerbacteria bacterium RBG_13_37_8]|uniref:DUF5667 domain-containing protein n=1 Tax=Candidatus Fischerbacteria bacterium RBG_13_37_8 TaxID=1817863 RepID=A0A1F5VMW0_9BACT|nr:MAG: hypothetical protein A2Y62_14750 [Candidatus Fischerbacteria bacterium RBG_13_37_8]